MVKYIGLWMKTVRTLSDAVFSIPFHSETENSKGGKFDAEYQVRKEKS